MTSESNSNEGTSVPEYLDQIIPGSFPTGQQPAGAAAASTHRTLSAAVYARRAEYTRPREIRIKVGTWNVAALKGTEKDLAGWFVGGKGVTDALAGLGVDDKSEGADSNPSGNASEEKEPPEEQQNRRSSKEETIPKNDTSAVPGEQEIGLYVLGLQEIVDVASPTEALRPYTDPTAANRYKSAMEGALPTYKLVAEQQLVGLLLLVYASPSVAPEVKAVSTTSVGTGLMGYMGNKGGVTARIVLGETTRLVFINAHLAAGADKASLDRRNWDANQIITRTKFEPIADSIGIPNPRSEGIGDEDFAFWFGDLNYRLEGMPGEDVRHLLSLHVRNEYGAKIASEASPTTTLREASGSPISITGRNSDANFDSKSHYSIGEEDDEEEQEEDAMSPDLDPTSLQTTLLSLLPHDELHQQQKARKAFHDGWREGPIKFLPTYKYDVGSIGTFDSSEKRRGPSWCDRILYRTRRDKLDFDDRVREEEEARKKDEEMKARGMDQPGDDDELLYDYNPETDGAGDADDYDEFADPEPETVMTKEGFEDEITLEYYTAHQRVLSSDHKPLDAVFKLNYDAVIPDLKAKIHNEVAKELDRAENEGRPTITLIVDRGSGGASIESDDGEGKNFEGVDFGHVRYGQSKRRSVTVANTGQVPCCISFVNRPVEKGQLEGPMPPWLSVHVDREADQKAQPSDRDTYTLEPGDACNIELTLRVEVMELVRNLNASKVDLDEVLVLRVENGRDHFLPVRGKWLQSSLGRSIDKLIRIPEGGIRKLQNQKSNSSPAASSPAAALLDQGVKWSAPRELFRLTESIEDLVERVLAEWQMTHEEGELPPWKANGGWPFEKESWDLKDQEARDKAKVEIYEALDCDQPFNSVFDQAMPTLHRLELLAEVLLVFLDSLEDGVIPSGLWTTIENAMIAREKSKQQVPLDDERTFYMELLAQEPTHNVSFVLLTSMIQRISHEIMATVRESSSGRPSANSSPSKKRESMDLPATPKGSMRKKTLSLSAIPEVARRQVVDRSLAAIFAEVMIKVEDPGKGKEKERRSDRMVRFVEVFVKES